MCDIIPILPRSTSHCCTIYLVIDDLYANFIETAKKAYKEKFGKEPIVIDVVIGDGSRKLC